MEGGGRDAPLGLPRPRRIPGSVQGSIRPDPCPLMPSTMSISNSSRLYWTLPISSRISTSYHEIFWENPHNDNGTHGGCLDNLGNCRFLLWWPISAVFDRLIRSVRRQKPLVH